MTDQIISYKVAVLAKAKGLPVGHESVYLSSDQSKPWNLDYVKDVSLVGEIYAAPTQSGLAKWLREKHNISAEVNICVDTTYGYSIYLIHKEKHFTEEVINFYYTDNYDYEVAMEQVLEESLKLLNDEK